jgi:hypothetical protein
MARRLASSGCLGLLLLLLPGSVLACISEPGSFEPPLFLMVFAVLETALLLTTGLGWLIQRRCWPQPDSDRRFYTTVIAAMLHAVALGAIGVFVIPAFKELFDSSGWDLPVATSTVVGAGPYLGLAVIVFSALCWAVRNHPQRTRYVAISLLLQASAFLWILCALYAPIFKLGCVV